MGTKFFVILNKKDLVFDMQDLVMAEGLSGTIGLGVNGVIAEFSDIEMDCIIKGDFLK